MSKFQKRYQSQQDYLGIRLSGNYGKFVVVYVNTNFSYTECFNVCNQPFGWGNSRLFRIAKLAV